ncbi:MAG: SAM-dependent methyltransferase [Cyanobacteriota bacterium]|nr:SAM-dependent methyltransferase [Cyanobacteriota bacterium]
MSQAAQAVPDWLLKRLQQCGGSVPFSTYMEWVLHDPVHGAYGSGRLQIGPKGDFATSPSLGADFAALLAPQLADWLGRLEAEASSSRPLSLVETGPGEGSLALQLAEELTGRWPQLASRCELVLVEPNAGMAERQRRLLEGAPMATRWCSFAELAEAPARGVVLAHEVLDALAVERICSDGLHWRRQRVVLREPPSAPPGLALAAVELLPPDLLPLLRPLRLEEPGPQRPSGWTTELHSGLQPWLRQASAALTDGWLLVIDYALEAWRYYAPARGDGTLLAYRRQEALTDPLLTPGCCDLTAHLCVEQLEAAAVASGWQPLGHGRQGEALLALGLAQRLHRLQHEAAPGQLAVLLSRREALLRLVDPHGLGGFRWLAYGRGETARLDAPPAFLRPPASPSG